MVEGRSFKDPIPSRLGEGHWAAARAGHLALQHCRNCGHWVHYPSAVCDQCLSSDLEWAEVSGRGTVETFSTVYRSFAAEFAADVPYTVAVVRLEEGVNLLTWLIEIQPEDVVIGMPVQATFEQISDAIALHRFKPTSSDETISG